jgi:hypothetical protein
LIISSPPAPGNRSAPSFKDFSRNLLEKRVGAAEVDSLRSISPHTSPDFGTIPYESTQQFSPYQKAIPDSVDPQLVPAPLSIYKSNSTAFETRSETSRRTVREEGERCESGFSKSSSEDSYVIYTGLRESVRAYLRHKLQSKRDSPKRERERVMSIASAKYPGMMTAEEHDRKHSVASRKHSVASRKHSVASRRVSVQQGISTIYNRLSRLSMSGPSSPNKADDQQPRTRQKQPAIPTSPYQKYGAAVWEAPKRQKRAKRQSAPVSSMMAGVGKSNSSRTARKPNTPIDPEVVDALRNERSQIIQALQGTKGKLTRTSSQKRREALKQSIQLVGPTDHISDGMKTYSLR